MKKVSDVYCTAFVILFLAVLNFALHAQVNTRSSVAISSGWFSTFQPSSNRASDFNKHYLGKVLSDTNTVTPPMQPETDSLVTQRSIKPGYVIGFAAIGFLSGLFFGAETFQGELSGVTFHLEPALTGAAIGAGLGVAVSLLETEKVEEKKK